MQISVLEIIELCQNNEVQEVKELMDAAGLDTSYRYPYTPSVAHLASVLLGIASALAHTSKLTDEMATLLIERLATRCEAYDLMELALLAKGVNTVKPNPKAVMLSEIMSGSYTIENRRRARELIRPLDEEELVALMYALIHDTGDGLRRGFNSLIVQHIYEKKVISTTMLFGFMASTLIVPGYSAYPGGSSNSPFDAFLRAFGITEPSDESESADDGPEVPNS